GGPCGRPANHTQGSAVKRVPCGPQNYRCLLPTSGDVRFWSSLLTSSRSKASGSNSPPTHSSISSCSGCCGSCIASRKLAYPQIPPQSSGGQARLPVRACLKSIRQQAV